MKEQLIELLGLDTKADESAIVKAVAEIKSALEASKPGKRELAIRKKMEVTGMSRTDAEHVVDQQAKEDAAREKAQAKSKKK